MQIFDCPKELAHYILFVNVLQNVPFLYHIVQICVHVLEYKVDVSEKILDTSSIKLRIELTLNQIRSLDAIF